MGMTGRLAAAALCGVAGMVAAGAAQAQWYGRVDLGWSDTTNADFADKDFALDGAICADLACTTAGKLQDLGSTFVAGAGVGYRFNRSLRGDVVLGFRHGYQLRGSDALGTQFSADVKSTALMVNAYWDFHLANKWMPYIGAGVGATQNEVKPISINNGGLVFGLPGGKTNDTAVALMAGLAIPMATFTFDFGYRYFDLGKIETNAGAVTFGSQPVGTYSGAIGNLRAHEIVVTIRF